MPLARYLRRVATEPERILWRHLRNRRFSNYKFRRQHPVADYVLDFYCPKVKLAVELDGGGHNVRDREIKDTTRSKLLAKEGITVLRFWNHQVREDLDSVLHAIWQALEDRRKKKEESLTLNPLPFSKGEERKLVAALCIRADERTRSCIVKSLDQGQGKDSRLKSDPSSQLM